MLNTNKITNTIYTDEKGGGIELDDFGNIVWVEDDSAPQDNDKTTQSERW